MGPVGLQGLQGLAGPAGEGLFSGALAFVEQGQPAPAGYSFIGSFNVNAKDAQGRNFTLRMDVYRRD
jgi:hypothetical protein